MLITTHETGAAVKILVWTDAGRHTPTANACAGDCGPAAFTYSRSGTGERERKENALDFGGAVAPTANLLFSDRDFTNGTGRLREGAWTDRPGKHRGLRAAVSGRAPGGGAGAR